jgi:sporulation protein YlmC with PRC-barrel domain
MKISSKKLLGLTVITKSGTELGRLDGFAMDTDFQSISEYYIKPEGLVEGLVKGKLIISRGQVLDISAKKMVVDDNYAAGAEKEKNKIEGKVVEGALMKE